MQRIDLLTLIPLVVEKEVFVEKAHAEDPIKRGHPDKYGRQDEYKVRTKIPNT